MRVDTSEYRANNENRIPRGLAYWAFLIDRETFFVSGKYADARKEAVKIAKERGALAIKLLS